MSADPWMEAALAVASRGHGVFETESPVDHDAIRRCARIVRASGPAALTPEVIDRECRAASDHHWDFELMCRLAAEHRASLVTETAYTPQMVAERWRAAGHTSESMSEALAAGRSAP